MQRVIARHINAGAREDFEKLLKLTEQHPEYKPVVYLWWSFLGPDLGGITEDQRKFSMSIRSDCEPGASLNRIHFSSGDTVID